MNRPPATLALAAVAAISAITNLTISLQFLGVLDWGSEDLDFWGGKWAGVFLFGLAGAIGVLVVYGWLTLKPWASDVHDPHGVPVVFDSIHGGYCRYRNLVDRAGPNGDRYPDHLPRHAERRAGSSQDQSIDCLIVALSVGEPFLVDRAGNWRGETDTFTARFDHHDRGDFRRIAVWSERREPGMWFLGQIALVLGGAGFAGNWPREITKTRHRSRSP